MVSPVKTMGHPQGRQSAAANAHKDTLVRIVKSLKRALRERTGSLVRMVAASLGQPATASAAAWEDIAVPTARLRFLAHVLLRVVELLAQSTARMVVSPREPWDSARASVASDGQELRARQHCNALLVRTGNLASTAARLLATQVAATVSALLGTLDQTVRQLTARMG